MKCINCLHDKTQVTNSRARKNGLSVWRRRKCPVCQYVSTSEETMSISGVYTVLSHGKTRKFEVVTLVLSIHAALQAASADSEAALPLSQTVQEHMVQAFRPTRPIESRDIAQIALPVIKRYNPLAGSIYAAQHNISEGRPGRPKKS